MNKKLIFFTIVMSILLIVLTIFCYINFWDKYHNKKSFENSILTTSEKDKNSIFSVDKIVYFSSCNANCDIASNASLTISNLYQYTDIAIFINNHATNENEYTLENTLKNVVINDIKFDLLPSVGTPNLYYKGLNDFASPLYNNQNLIFTDSFDFSITSEDEIDYSTPTLYNNCANPITFCYVNSNIKDNCTVPDVSSVLYNGNLLKKCNITLNSISCRISFKIDITNNLDEKYTCPFILQIPLSSESSTIYDGNLILKSDTNYSFMLTS